MIPFQPNPIPTRSLSNLILFLLSPNPTQWSHFKPIPFLLRPSLTWSQSNSVPIPLNDPFQPNSIHSQSNLLLFLLSQTSKTSIRWRKWFMETSQTITVTSQIHSRLYYYQSSTSNHHAPFPSRTHTQARTCVCACTHTHTTLSVLFFRTSQTK